MQTAYYKFKKKHSKWGITRRDIQQRVLMRY